MKIEYTGLGDIQVCIDHHRHFLNYARTVNDVDLPESDISGEHPLVVEVFNAMKPLSRESEYREIKFNDDGVDEDGETMLSFRADGQAITPENVNDFNNEAQTFFNTIVSNYQ